MPKYSRTSQERLSTCHDDLQKIFNEVIKHFDCTIIEGHRSPERQKQLYLRGASKLKSGSKHNEKPSHAVDAVPYPIDWGDRERMSYFAGQVQGIAHMMGIKIRWGGDWDQDTQVRDNRFDDLVHFELIS